MYMNISTPMNLSVHPCIHPSIYIDVYPWVWMWLCEWALILCQTILHASAFASWNCWMNPRSCMYTDIHVHCLHKYASTKISECTWSTKFLNSVHVCGGAQPPFCCSFARRSSALFVDQCYFRTYTCRPLDNHRHNQHSLAYPHTSQTFYTVLVAIGLELAQFMIPEQIECGLLRTLLDRFPTRLNRHAIIETSCQLLQGFRCGGCPFVCAIRIGQSFDLPDLDSTALPMIRLSSISKHAIFWTSTILQLLRICRLNHPSGEAGATRAI